jgi:hypothetical protein
LHFHGIQEGKTALDLAKTQEIRDLLTAQYNGEGEKLLHNIALPAFT